MAVIKTNVGFHFLGPFREILVSERNPRMIACALEAKGDNE